MPGTLHSQSAFVQLPDSTGYAYYTTHFVYDSLKSASTALQGALPSAYQSDFAVYDIGFYTHHRSYEGGPPSVLQEAIEDFSTPYYLVFGREFNLDDELERVWVEVEMPEGDFFMCLEPETKAFHAHLAGTFVNSPTIIGKNNSFLYMEQVKAAIEYLIDVFTELEVCCNQQSGLRSGPQCSHCPSDIQQFRSFMEDNGFVGLEVENLLHSPKYDTTGNLREYTEMTIELDADPLDLNDDVMGFLQRMDNAMEGVFGSIYFYDPLDPLCKNIMEVVSGTFSLPVALQGPGVSRAAIEEAVLEITTVGTVDELGGGMVHIKVNIPIQMTNTGKTIYLKCLDDCGFNMDSIQYYLTNFYSLLGKYPIEVWPDPPAAGPPVTDSIPLIPDIQISTQKLTKEIVQDGVVVLFGEASILIDRIQHPDFYRDMAGSWGSSSGLYPASVCHLITTENLLGKGQSNPPNRFALIKNNGLSNHIQLFKAKSELNFVGFLALHETGHTAGIKDETNLGLNHVRYCQSYMSNANCILAGYLGQNIYPGFCQGGICYSNGMPFDDLETLVYETMKDEKYLWIKDAIFNRFFK